MDNLVARLRRAVLVNDLGHACHEAADEIVRLRSALVRIANYPTCIDEYACDFRGMAREALAGDADSADEPPSAPV